MIWPEKTSKTAPLIWYQSVSDMALSKDDAFYLEEILNNMFFSYLRKSPKNVTPARILKAETLAKWLLTLHSSWFLATTLTLYNMY